LNKEGGKLSKRQGDVAVEDYKNKGYLPEALLNFCVLQGWHPKDDNEILSLDEIIKKFRYEDMGTSPAIFDVEKLDYFNGYYIRQMSIEKLTKLCLPFLGENLKLTKNQKKLEETFIKKAIGLEQERLKKLSEIGELTQFFFKDELVYDASLLVWKKLTVEDVKTNLQVVYDLLEKIAEPDWLKENLEKDIIDYLKERNLKLGDYLWPMRVALTGLKASPGPFEVAEVLGKAESLGRVNQAVKKL